MQTKVENQTNKNCEVKI